MFLSFFLINLFIIIFFQLNFEIKVFFSPNFLYYRNEWTKKELFCGYRTNEPFFFRLVLERENIELFLGKGQINVLTGYTFLLEIGDI